MPDIAEQGYPEAADAQQVSLPIGNPADLMADDFEAVRGLAGVSGDDWPDARIGLLPYLGAARAEARRRVPCDWTLLDDSSIDALRLALIYQTASLIVPAANPSRTEDFKIGSFSLKTGDALLLGDAGELMGWANQYYSEVALPDGIVPFPVGDAFARPVIRKAHTSRRRLFGRC